MSPRFSRLARWASLAFVLLLAFPASLAESCCCSTHPAPDTASSKTAQGCCPNSKPAGPTLMESLGGHCGCDSMTAPNGRSATNGQSAVTVSCPRIDGKFPSADGKVVRIVAPETNARAGWNLDTSPPSLSSRSESKVVPTRGPPAFSS